MVLRLNLNKISLEKRTFLKISFRHNQAIYTNVHTKMSIYFYFRENFQLKYAEN